jgi:peptidoglycan/LPS O-acetylase OafA/YrhL
MQFRKDINGLRAIAVISVVLFHFNAAWMPGGFAGVDVFFVISGFLMTGIIFRGIEQDNFSLLKFYVARANRIIPALAALCLVLLVFGWFYLNSIDYKALGNHVASSLVFVSNIVYWKESGYFAASSHEKWLLHTWSLSAEWQFYILYPLMLVVMRKFMSITAMKATVLVGTTLGFIFCIVVTYKWPNSAYYLLPTRAWEMMIGGVAYLYPWTLSAQKKQRLEWLGLLLIVASYFFISKDSPWPGYLALFPVLGAFFILQAQRNDSVITNNIIFQKLGAWSYSIYLWHWPLVVAIYYYSLNDVFIYFGLVLSVLLGFLSNKYVEKIKFRNDFSGVISYLKCQPMYLVMCIGLFSVFIFLSDGANTRFSKDLQIKNSNAIAAIDDWYYPEPNLTVGNSKIRFIKGSSNKNILFIGASHTEQTYPYAESLGSEYNIYYLTAPDCLVIPSYIKKGGKVNCSNIQDYKSVLENMNFDKLVTSFYLFGKNLSADESIKNEQISMRVSEYDNFLKFVKSEVKEVFVILGEPKGREFDPKLSLRNNLDDSITINQAREAYVVHEQALSQLKELNNIVVIDPIDYLCNELCMVRDESFNFYYSDKTHMRPWYAKKSLGYLQQIFK